MKNYSIVRIGNEYVVQAGETRILKVSSRRLAAKLITEAAELLEQGPTPPTVDSPSIGSEHGIMPDPHRGMPDPCGTAPDPAEVS